MAINREENTDRLLVARLKKSDKRAFEAIYNKYFSQIYRFVSSILFDDFLSEDITQSIFLTLWENRTTLEPEKNFNNYLFTIARNRVYRHIERLVLKNKLDLHLSINSKTYIEIDDEINKDFLEKILNEIIEELPPARKKIFILSRFKNLSNKEIASRLRISEKTVSVQISRSVVAVKEKMRYFLSVLF
ncbi:MAG: RNA polymerase sigma-70 factor [Paludibacteraceae bacterium]